MTTASLSSSFSNPNSALMACANSPSLIAILSPIGRVKNGSQRMRITSSTGAFELLLQLTTNPTSRISDAARMAPRHRPVRPESVHLISSRRYAPAGAESSILEMLRPSSSSQPAIVT